MQRQRCPLPFSLKQKSLPTSRRRHKKQRLPGIISINTANFWQRCANDKVPTGNGHLGRGPAHKHTHTRSHTEHAYKYTKVFFSNKSPFWLCSAEPFGLFSTAAAVSCVLLCLYLCVRVFLCVCAFTSFLWEKSRNHYEPASCLPCHAPSSNIFIFFYVSPSERRSSLLLCGSAAPLLSQLFGAPSTAAEQFWGLTLTRLRHTRARTLKVGVEVRPTTRTRHLDEFCLLSLGFGV